MAFGWEAVMTFVLVAVVYAVAIGKPSFTETGPLAVGFSLWASVIVGTAQYPQKTNIAVAAYWATTTLLCIFHVLREQLLSSVGSQSA